MVSHELCLKCAKQTRKTSPVEIGTRLWILYRSNKWSKGILFFFCVLYFAVICLLLLGTILGFNPKNELFHIRIDRTGKTDYYDIYDEYNQLEMNPKFYVLNSNDNTFKE